MRKILVILAMVLGIGSAAFAEPVYVGKKVTTPLRDGDLINTFVSYDEDFDWDVFEDAKENVLWDFYKLQSYFDMHFEVGVTYTFHCRDPKKGPYVITFQRLTEDEGRMCGNWRWILTYTNE